MKKRTQQALFFEKVDNGQPGNFFIPVWQVAVMTRSRSFDCPWRRDLRVLRLLRKCITIFCIISLIFPIANLQVYASAPAPLPADLPPPPFPPPKKRTAKPSKQILELVEVKSDTNGPPQQSTPSNVQPLSAERLDELAALLPPMRKSGGAAKFDPISYIKQPPPKTKIVEQEFPPQSSETNKVVTPESVKGFPLKITRISYTGEVSDTSSLKVSFNQPMVAISSPEISDSFVPVKLIPSVSGTWHWIDAQTIQFSPKAKSLPSATTFTVAVPVGTRSVTGATLEQEYTSKFSTPTPRVVDFAIRKKNWEDVADSLTPLIALRFNQKIDPFKVIKFVLVKVHGKPVSFRLASATEIKGYQVEQNTAIRERARTVYLKTLSSLPKNSEVKVSVSPGVPSVEGPDKGHELQEYSFRTYAPFQLDSSRKEAESIYRGGSAGVTFNNEIDVDSCNPSMFSVTPPVKNFAVSIDRGGVTATGNFQLGSAYSINISSQLKDIYGQFLTGSHTARYICKPRPPQIFKPADDFGQMIPSSKPVYRVFSYNEPSVKVSILEANVSDWKNFRKASADFPRNPKGALNTFASSKKLFTRVFKTTGKLENWFAVPIDLQPLVKDGHSHFIVVVDAAQGVEQRFMQWVEYSATRMNIINDGINVHAMITDIPTGKPVSGAEVTLLPSGAKGRTEPGGVATIAVPDGEQSLLQCQSSGRTTLLPYPGDFEHFKYSESKGDFVVYQNTDRNLYRPGETVHLNGFVRWCNYLEKSALSVPGESIKFDYVVTSSNRSEIAKGATKSDANGVFSFEFKVPEAVELGDATVNLNVGASTSYKPASSRHETTFKIQEFRRPEFEVSVESDKNELVLGDFAVVDAKGSYRTGSVLPHSKVHWHVKSQSTAFSAAGFEGFTFDSKEFEDEDRNTAESSLNGVSGKDGIDKLKLRCAALAAIEPVDLVVDATVQDLNRQEWTQTTRVKVHPADLYVGLKSHDDKPLQPKSAKVFDFVVTDTSGKTQPNFAVHLIATRDTRNSADELVEKVVEEIDSVSGMEAQSCTFHFTEIGNYHIAARVVDRQGRFNRSKLAVDVESPEEAAGNANPTDDSQSGALPLKLALDRESYKPHETAQLKIESPFKSGHGLLTLKSNFVVGIVPFEVVNGTATIPLPVDETYCPEVKVEATLFGAHNVTANGEASLSVPTDPVNIEVTAGTKSETYRPGQSVDLKISLKDAQGKLVSGGQVALAVVDESVLALTNYSWDNPLSTFYASKSYEGDDDIAPTILDPRVWKPEYEDNDVRKKEAPAALPPPPLPGGGASGMSDGAPRPPLIPAPSQSADSFVDHGKEAAAPDSAVKVRSDLSPLAYFNPAIITGADGSADVSFTLPGNLTRYKVMAVASKNAGQFGVGSSLFTSKLPLMVRPSLPRFLNFSDRCELPFIVENTTDKSVSADLIVRASNLTDTSVAESGSVPKAESKGGSNGVKNDADADSVYLNGRHFEIPANDRVEIRLPVEARTAGSANIQVATFANGSSDASELSIPLQAPVTAESFATYGTIDQGVVAQKIVAPTNVINEIGGLEITTSSTAMQQLDDARDYLVNYPYACSEQLSSQILGLGALGDLITQFKTAAPKGVDLPQIAALESQNVLELCKRQQTDGGFGLWVKDENVKFPFVSIQCARALYECTKHNIPVPPGVIENCKKYLRNAKYNQPKLFGKKGDVALKAYSLNTRFQMGDAKAIEARKIISDAIDSFNSRKSKESKTGDGAELSMQEVLARVMSLETMAWLLPVLASDSNGSSKELEAIQNIFASSIDETSSTASVIESPYGNESYLFYYSANRMSAVVLESLIASQPTNEVIPKLVKGLLQTRRNGIWLSTQDNACSLVALSKYFAKFEKDEPDFIAQFWLGEAVSFEQKFSGRSLDSNDMKIPMDYLQKHLNDNLLTIAKKGIGRLYYRIGVKSASTELKLPASDRGFSVERSYLPVDSPDDVTRGTDGTLHVKAGATIKVSVKISAPGWRYHVAMVDPFPAGFEALNPDLSGTRSVSENGEANTGGEEPSNDNVETSSANSSPGEGSAPTVSIDEEPMCFWRGTWFDHQNLRDNQAEAFATSLPGGKVEYTYYVRATTAGKFIVPPCRVEEMYNSETFGRTATEFVEIR